MTKLLLDPDMKATARIIAYVSEPESLATGMMFKICVQLGRPESSMLGGATGRG